MQPIVICSLAMLRAELRNAKIYGSRGERTFGWCYRNKLGTASYPYFN